MRPSFVSRLFSHKQGFIVIMADVCTVYREGISCRVSKSTVDTIIIWTIQSTISIAYVMTFAFWMLGMSTMYVISNCCSISHHI